MSGVILGQIPRMRRNAEKTIDKLSMNTSKWSRGAHAAPERIIRLYPVRVGYRRGAGLGCESSCVIESCDKKHNAPIMQMMMNPLAAAVQ